MNRAINVDNILNKKFELMHFHGAWRRSYRQPAKKGTWLMWGRSGHGKTTHAFQLAKYLCNFGKVYYNTIEEGLSPTIQATVKRLQYGQVKGRFFLLDKEPISMMKERLREKRSAQFNFIDSLQYSRMSKDDYIALKDEFPDKLFIFISHADNTEPAGATADFIRYDSDVKIYIEGFRAITTSRYGSTEDYDIWPAESAQYYLQNQ